MNIIGKNEDRLQKAVLSSDMFTTGYFVVCLLFFVPYAVSACGTVVLWVLPIACLLPFVTLPLFYSLVHRFDTLMFGRYHLVMPLSGFVSALFFVVMMSARGGGAVSICSVFLGAALFVTSIMLYRYCSFSVRARLLSEDITAASPYSLYFSVFGGVAAAVTFLGFWYYDRETAYINTAYVFAGACAIVTIAQYLSTFYDIPRLSGRRVQSLKSVFRSFFSGLDLRTYFSALFFSAAFAVLAASVMYIAFVFDFGLYRLAATAGVCVVAFAVSDGVCTAIVKHRSKALSVALLLGFIAAAALTAVAACVPVSDSALRALVIIAAGLTGVCGALSVRQTKLRFLTVKPRITGGVVFILLQLTACAAQAIAFVVCAAQSTVLAATGSTLAFVCGGGAAAVFAITAFACAGKKRSKAPAAPGLSYELECDAEAVGVPDAEPAGEK